MAAFSPVDYSFFYSPIILHMPEERERGALLIAACLIAAIRLRGEPIKRRPKLKSTIYDSVQLAVLVCGRYKGTAARH